MPVSDLQNPAKLKQLVERFTAAYDFNTANVWGRPRC